MIVSEEQVETSKEKFNNTNKDIQKLINPAVAISLAKSYEDTRKHDYKKYSYAMFGNYILFLLPITLILIYLLYPSLILVKVETSTRYIDNLLKHISVIIPCSVISWFGLNSIKKNKHMQDEYNHKQRVMQTYIGFKGQNKEDSSLLEKLNEIVVNTVAENPNKKFKEDHHFINKIIQAINNVKNK